MVLVAIVLDLVDFIRDASRTRSVRPASWTRGDHAFLPVAAPAIDGDVTRTHVGEWVFSRQEKSLCMVGVAEWWSEKSQK